MASHFRIDDIPARPRRLRAVTVFGWVILFCGALLMLMPDFYKASNSLSTRTEIETALRAVNIVSSTDSAGESAQAEDSRTVSGSSEPVDDALIVANKAASSRPWLEEYNEQVRNGTGPGINDPFTFDPDDQSFAATGLADLPVGVLTVRSMDVEVPVYLGSSDENMRRGATVVAGTSAPLGETSSNCVIAAHRSSYFREMESVKTGDRVELRTIWGSYVYEVTETKLIYPNEIENVSVQEGRDLLTISTCHPYGETTQRILAVCERVPGAEVESASKTDDGIYGDEAIGSIGAIQENAANVVKTVVGVEPVVNIVRIVSSGEAAGELLAEDFGRVLGRVILMFITLRFIVWLVSGGRGSRKARRGRAPRRRSRN